MRRRRLVSRQNRARTDSTVDSTFPPLTATPAPARPGATGEQDGHGYGAVSFSLAFLLHEFGTMDRLPDEAR